MECVDEVMGGACDDLIALYQALIDDVCDYYPSCSVCEEGFVDPGADADEDECQQAIDDWDYDTYWDSFETLCQLEEESDL